MTTLPIIVVPPRNDSTEVDRNIGKVLLDGKVFTPDEVITFARQLDEAANTASRAATQRTPGGTFTGDGMTLLSDPLGGWQGTFAIAVQRLLRDLLTDDQSIEVNLLVDFPDQQTLVSGMLVEVGDQALTFQDGVTVSIDDVEAVQVPS